MKRETGKKIGKIVLMVGVIVYAVMVCPVNPTRMKPAKSYEQLRDTVEKKTDIRVPGEDLLPWTVTERQFRMDGPSRLAKVSGFAISGTMERGGVTFDVEVSVGVIGVVGDLPPCWDSYRYVPIYLFQNRGFYMTQLYIDGNGVPHGGGSVSVTGKETCHEARNREENYSAGGTAGSCGRHRVYRADLADISPTPEKRG